MKTILSILVFVLVHECATQDSISYHISSPRRFSGRDEGNLLKALSGSGSEINVAFTGITSSDTTTEFVVQWSNAKLADAFKYNSGNSSYYLAAVAPENPVKLHKLNGFPTDDKYFFVIRFVPGKKYRVIESLKTRGEFLHCDANGKALMKKVNSSDLDPSGMSLDRKTWFRMRV